jgi:hypothetical protein
MLPVSVNIPYFSSRSTQVGAVPWLKLLVTGLSQQKSRLNPAGFVVDKVALGQVFH